MITKEDVVASTSRALFRAFPGQDIAHVLNNMSYTASMHPCTTLALIERIKKLESKKMTYEEHENVVTSAANALYSAIHSAKIDNLRISVGMETLYTMGEGITYICDSLDISLVDPMKNVSEGSIAKYRDAIMSVLEDLTDALTAAARDNYSFNIERVEHGGTCFANVLCAESKLDAS